MPNATVFSILDTSSGFWQIKRTRRVSNSALSTPRLGDTCLRDYHSSCDVFQRVMTQMFEDLEGVEVVVDDILIWENNEQQHDDRLIRVLVIEI